MITIQYKYFLNISFNSPAINIEKENFSCTFLLPFLFLLVC